MKIGRNSRKALIHTSRRARKGVEADFAEVYEQFYNRRFEYRQKMFSVPTDNFPLMSIDEYVSTRSHKWLLFQYSEHRREHSGKERRKCIRIENNVTGEKAALELIEAPGRKWIVRWAVHFFSRYVERMGFSNEGEGILRTFFRRNKRYLIATKQDGTLDSNARYDVVIFTEDGAGLGVKKGRRIVITTFLPKRYFAKWQQDIYERFEQDSKITLLTLEEFIENMN